MYFILKINKRVYNVNVNGTKTVEARDYKPGSQLSTITHGDIILFTTLDILGGTND